MDPRISFSSDFVDIEQATKYENGYREAPVSSDFEFSVKKYNMIPADEIFFKGMVMPSKKGNCGNRLRRMTLREELLVDDEFEDESPRVNNASTSGWWKERLGLKKSHNEAKKVGKNNGVLEKVVEEKGSVFLQQEERLDSD